jgi:hypothetical protein
MVGIFINDFVQKIIYLDQGFNDLIWIWLVATLGTATLGSAATLGTATLGSAATLGTATLGTTAAIQTGRQLKVSAAVSFDS